MKCERRSVMTTKHEDETWIHAQMFSHPSRSRLKISYRLQGKLANGYPVRLGDWKRN